jgi:hypothetical protein
MKVHYKLKLGIVYIQLVLKDKILEKFGFARHCRTLRLSEEQRIQA